MTAATQHVVFSSELTPEFTLAQALAKIAQARGSHYGIIKLHSRTMRGVIGIFCGTYIFGAFDKTTNRYGIPALKHLLSADYGIIAFLEQDDAPPDELSQQLGIPLDELLALSQDSKISLADALFQLSGQSYGLQEVQPFEERDIDHLNMQNFVERTSLAAPESSRVQLKESLWLRVERSHQGTGPAYKSAAALKGTMTHLKAITDEEIRRAKGGVVVPVRKSRPAWLMYAYSAVGTLIFVAMMTQILKGLQFQQQYKQGLFALKNGGSTSALLAFEASHKLNPKAAEVHYFKAIASQRAGDYRKAIGEFDQAIRIDPKSTAAIVGRASAWLKLKEYDPAIHDADAAIAVNPNTLSAYAIKAIAAVNAGSYQNAIDAATYYIDRVDKAKDAEQTASVLSARAAAYSQTEKLQEAIADYSAALELKPDSLAANVGRATCYMDIDDFDSAIKDCDKAQKIDPTDPGIYLMRGHCYASKHQLAEALEDFDTAVKMKPTLAAYRMRADTQFQRHDYGAARADYEYIVSLNSGDKEAVARLKECHLSTDKTVKPMNEYLRQLQQDADSAGATVGAAKNTDTTKLNAPQLVAQGYRALEAHQFDQAVTALVAALRQNPNDPTARRYLAHSYYGLNAYSQAEDQFMALRKLQPLTTQDQIVSRICLKKMRQPRSGAASRSEVEAPNESGEP